MTPAMVPAIASSVSAVVHEPFQQDRARHRCVAGFPHRQAAGAWTATLFLLGNFRPRRAVACHWGFG